MNLNTPVRIVATEQELQELASQMDEQRRQQGRTSHFREQVDRAIREGRVVNAFMSPTTGEVVVYAPSIWNGASGVGTVAQRMAQAMERGQQVVAHEVLAHQGLRQLLGEEAFKELCEQIYKGMSKYARAKYVRYHWDNNLSEETKKRLVGEDLAAKSWDKLTPIEKAQIWASPEMATELRQGAADEYAAHLAEKVIGNETLTPKEQSIWEKIVSAIKKLFGQMDDTAIADALVQARDNLRQGEEAEPQIIGEEGERFSVEEQEFNTPQGENTEESVNNGEAEARFSAEEAPEAPQNEDLFARAERIANNYQQQREQQREEAMRFRVKYDQESARDAYEQAVRSGLFQSVEALQDSQRSVFVAMKSILGQKRLHIEDVPDFMNAYTGENRLSSVNQAEMEIAARQLFTPLLREVARLAPTRQTYTELVDYMMAKHGLERNRYMAEREAQKQFAEYQAITRRKSKKKKRFNTDILASRVY